MNIKPQKNNVIGKGVKFERIRRLTDYLNGTLDRWNNAKEQKKKTELNIQ